MALENVGKFEELLSSDEALQEKMRELVAAFEGDKEDDRAYFDAVIARLAQEAGLPFTYEEAEQHTTESRELADDELDAVAGGASYCFFVGGGSKPEAEACEGDEHGTGIAACAYVGVGFSTIDG